MENLPDLVRRRATVKAALTRHVNIIGTIDQDGDMQQVRVRLDSVLPLLGQFNEIQDEIDFLNETEAEDEINAACAEFEERYFTLVANMKTLLNPPVTRNVESLSTVSPTPPRSSFRLPEIKLPRFDGAIERWVSFRDTFTSMVHSDVNLLDLQKFQYLKSCLSGVAADVVEAIDTKGENYTKAWEALRERFEHRRLIVQQHARALHDLSYDAKNRDGLRSFIDDINRHMRALSALGATHDGGELTNALLVHLLSSKLDLALRSEWEKSLTTSEVPKYEEFLKFVTQQCNVRSAVLISTDSHGQSTHKVNPQQPKKPHKPPVAQGTLTFVARETACPACKLNEHILFRCPKFGEWQPKERFQFVKNARLCLNCLKPDHLSKDCKSGKCRHCKGAHNSLLCFASSDSTNRVESSSTSSDTVAPSAAASATYTSRVLTTECAQHTFLATVQVCIENSNTNSTHIVRALLDCGSQSNYISQRIRQWLGLATHSANTVVAGLHDSTLQVCYKTSVSFKSSGGEHRFALDCFVIPSIAERAPLFDVDTSSLQIPVDLRLADPNFYRAKSIDMLIGADLFWQIIGSQTRASNLSSVHFHQTSLGWIVVGSICRPTVTLTRCHLSVDTLGRQLTRFWEIEEPSQPKRTFSLLDQKCEELFSATTRRDQSGRYVVDLPLRESPNSLGDSYATALSRFGALEAKFRRLPAFRAKYVEFMAEYALLGHMSLTPDSPSTSLPNEPNLPSYLIPHHGVFRGDRIRVVFDASSKSSSKKSLNDIVFTGPKLQTELIDILLRFRQHKFVLVADLVKMYRQILINPEQRHLQQILWRDSPEEPIGTYTLNTVTYGIACAPYLAIRGIAQLCQDEAVRYPLASQIASRDMYVDDLITGHDDLATLADIREQLIEMFGSAGCELHKWRSNDPSLIVSPEDSTLTFASEEKTLGIVWNNLTDNLSYALTLTRSEQITKRKILSVLAQIFDPLGLLGPIIVIGKAFLQRVWKLDLAWDDQVSDELASKWSSFIENLEKLRDLQIPRRVISDNFHKLELHGFCDASEFTYAACVYVRSCVGDDSFDVRLLCAKTRVAPLKKITLPRLELCAAELLATLMTSVKSTLNVNVSATYLWSDSSIALSWIHAESGSWHTFVANRVSKIQALTRMDDWGHIASELNPADIASREALADVLLTHEQWWHGPPFLKNPSSEWPDSKWVSHSDSFSSQGSRMLLISRDSRRTRV